MGLDELKKYIKTINLYPTKAKHIIKTCELLVEKFNSAVPNDRDALESLPGVGRKTANVVLNTAFNQPTIAVDTHIFRVANRTGLAKGKTPLIVEKKLLKTKFGSVANIRKTSLDDLATVVGEHIAKLIQQNL